MARRIDGLVSNVGRVIDAIAAHRTIPVGYIDELRADVAELVSEVDLYRRIALVSQEQRAQLEGDPLRWPECRDCGQEPPNVTLGCVLCAARLPSEYVEACQSILRALYEQLGSAR